MTNSSTRIARQAFVAVAACLAIAGPAAAQDLTETIANAAGVPQIPAFLPDRYSVARSEALPIDGVWMISTLKKKIRIEQGRAYAVDPWLHLFVLKVQPDMVVMQNFRRTAPGKYAADDLPLMGPAELALNTEGNLDVRVQGTFGPVKYGLVRVEAQYAAALTQEIQAATGRNVDIPDYSALPVAAAPLPGMPGSAPGGAPVAEPLPHPAQPPATQPPPRDHPVMPAPLPDAGTTPADCTPIGIDPDTNQTICAY